MKPPAVVAAMRTRFTDVPRARAASAESPTIRTHRPQRVWARAQVMASAMAMPRGNIMLICKAAATAPESLQLPNGIEGICGACG